MVQGEGDLDTLPCRHLHAEAQVTACQSSELDVPVGLSPVEGQPAIAGRHQRCSDSRRGSSDGQRPIAMRPQIQRLSEETADEALSWGWVRPPSAVRHNNRTGWAPAAVQEPQDAPRPGSHNPTQRPCIAQQGNWAGAQSLPDTEPAQRALSTRAKQEAWNHTSPTTVAPRLQQMRKPARRPARCAAT